MVRWAHFERQVQQMVWAVAFNGHPDGHKLGRLSIIEPRTEKRLRLLVNLAKVRNITYDEESLTKVRKQCKAIVEERNLLAHGAWTKTKRDGWLVQQTQGAWEESDEEPSGPKKVSPEAVSRTAAQIAKTAKALEVLIAETRNLQISLEYAP